MFGIAGENLTKRLRIEMFVSMVRQEMGWYDRKENGVGALCARLSSEAAQVQGVRKLFQCVKLLTSNQYLGHRSKNWHRPTINIHHRNCSRPFNVL